MSQFLAHYTFKIMDSEPVKIVTKLFNLSKIKELLATLLLNSRFKVPMIMFNLTY